MRRNRSGGIILFLAVLILLPAICLSAQEKSDPAPPKTLEELQKAIKSELDKSHASGAGVALVSRGELLWCGGFGDADIASNKPITCDTEFRVGSISKSFVALALLWSTNVQLRCEPSPRMTAHSEPPSLRLEGEVGLSRAAGGNCHFLRLCS